MLYFVKIDPSLFLLADAPVKSGVLKVPLEIPGGCFSHKNQRAAGDGTGELGRACIG